MKAAVLTRNQHIELGPVPHVKPAKKECRIRIRRTGVCSSDIRRSFENGAYHYPLVLGHEIAGEITEVGEEVERFRPKDRIVVFPLLPCFECGSCKQERFALCKSYDYYGSRRDGGFAEFLNVQEWNLVKIPQSLPFENACLAEPVAVVIHALRRIGLMEPLNTPPTLAIIGMGFLGQVATRILSKIFPDPPITVIDRNRYKLDLVKGNVRRTCLKEEQEWESYLKTHGNSFSHVIEATGNANAFRNSLRLSEAGGTVEWVGNIHEVLSIPPEEVSMILRKELKILGTWNSDFHPNRSNDWTDALSLMGDGLELNDLISLSVSLDEVPLALRKLYDQKSRKKDHQLIKVIVKND